MTYYHIAILNSFYIEFDCKPKTPFMTFASTLEACVKGHAPFKVMAAKFKNKINHESTLQN